MFRDHDFKIFLYSLACNSCLQTPCLFLLAFQSCCPFSAMVLIGEPNRWETHLQLLVDLLLTGGHPSFAPEGGFPNEHIPVLACNMDLVFMAEACMPRYAHISAIYSYWPTDSVSVILCLNVFQIWRSSELT